MTVLAFGAAGKFAGLLIPALAQRGVKVRGFIRKPDQAEQVKSRGAAEIARGDLTDPASLAMAFQGIEAVFYVAPAFVPGEVEIGKRVVDMAVQAGVRRFVFSAVIHPVISGLSNHAAKASVEEAVLNSGLEYTFLHPGLYFQNYAAAWPQIVERGVLAEPWSVETHFARVDYRDVAEVAAIALTKDRLLYGTFELCAAGNLNRTEVATLIGEVLGRSIKVERRDPEALGRVPPPLKAMFEHYDHHGMPGNSLSLRTILEREPRTLRAYFQELVAAHDSVSPDIGA